MTEMELIKWLLFLFTITVTQSKSILIRKDYSIGEGIMKTILESCYAENSFSNPVVIFGKFNKLVEGVSIIRINDSLNAKDYEHHESLKFKASAVVLMEEHPEKLVSHLQLLRRTKLWNNLVPFFIIGKNTVPCTNSGFILKAMWQMEILNSIYICPNFMHTTPEIYTLNPITNYAPDPWEIIYKFDDLHFFRQNFDANMSCVHLTYDKTKFLNGYNTVVGSMSYPGSGAVPGSDQFHEGSVCPDVRCIAMHTLITAFNATVKIVFEREVDAMIKRCFEGSVDTTMLLSTHDSFPNLPYLLPFYESEMIAVVKLKAEVSTLEKIYQLWSTPVLIVAGFALAILFLILMIKRWSFGLALLDLTRLLTYTSIQADNGYQSFRIYFSTMLIFMVISNGVFQGKIAAFLTTREKGTAAESINELIELGYQMYTVRESILYAQNGCPRCEFKGVSTWDECIEFVLNGTKNLCVMDKMGYESKYILLPLDRVRESFTPQLMGFKCRCDWPLRDRFNDMMMRVIEAGLPDYWNMKSTSIRKAKRQSREAEWASAEYRPVALHKLDFAFKLLAAGLSLATVVFFLELCWARYVNP